VRSPDRPAGQPGSVDLVRLEGLEGLDGVPAVMSEACDIELAEHGDTARGAGYVRGEASARTCYEVMLGIIRPGSGPVSVLDFGCGTGGLLTHLATRRDLEVDYTGLDLSADALALARRKHPTTPFLQADVLADPSVLDEYDYVIVNGVFHWRGDLSVGDMTRYWQALLSTLYARCRIGLAFNVMSDHVDWRRDDLFHVGFDTLAAFATERLTRHLVMRADYGTYEYTAYLYREPYAA
jgi:SAM-dependent methyltransferase